MNKRIGRLLGHLEMIGHIALQKTNVSSTITLLHWVKNDNANDPANGKQTVQQKNSKRYTNNIVNTENTVNIENTPSKSVKYEDSIEIIRTEGQTIPFQAKNCAKNGWVVPYVWTPPSLRVRLSAFSLSTRYAFGLSLSARNHYFSSSL